MPPRDLVDTFLQHWTSAVGCERTDDQLFVGNLARLPGVPLIGRRPAG